MGAFTFVQKLKGELQRRESVKYQKEAEKLAALRKERIRLEGQQRLLKIRRKEESRIEKAKKYKLEHGNSSKVKKALTAIKKHREERERKEAQERARNPPKTLFNQ